MAANKRFGGGAIVGRTSALIRKMHVRIFSRQRPSAALVLLLPEDMGVGKWGAEGGP